MSQNIESVLHEQRVFEPPVAFSRSARMQAADLERLRREAREDPLGYWARLAREHIHWQKPFTRVLDDSAAPNYRWFTDGELNVSVNCLDLHLTERADKTAIIFEGEAGDVRKLTYGQLHAEVSRCPNSLRALGIEPGDRVVIYMPLVPEAVVAMQALAEVPHRLAVGYTQPPSPRV